MKSTFLTFLALAVGCLGFAASTSAQTNSPAVNLNAQAWLAVETNHAKLFLTVHVVNAGDREITVLTRNLNLGIELANDQLQLSLGYENRPPTYQGHPIIPSLCDFSPVTLRPNEEAIIRRELTDGVDVLAKQTDLPIVVSYGVSPDWGKRFSVWNGTAKTQPFAASLRK